MPLGEFDLIRSQDGIIWVVHGILDNAHICRPKYIPDERSGKVEIHGRSYMRLHSPLVRGEPPEAEKVLQRYPRYQMDPDLILGLHLISENEIEEIFPAQSDDCPQGGSAARAYNDFKEMILNNTGIHPESIGRTGSLALGFEVPGHSDLDIVIYGGTVFSMFCNAMRDHRCPGVQLMDETQWSIFHDRFQVASQHPKCIFVERMMRRFDQGFYNGIQFTIFVAREKPRSFPHLYGRFTKRNTRGTITDAYEKYYYPAAIHVADGQNSIRIESWDRVDRGIFEVGDEIEAEGYACDNLMFVVPNHGLISHVAERKG